MSSRTPQTVNELLRSIKEETNYIYELDIDRIRRSIPHIRLRDNYFELLKQKLEKSPVFYDDTEYFIFMDLINKGEKVLYIKSIYGDIFIDDLTYEKFFSLLTFYWQPDMIVGYDNSMAPYGIALPNGVGDKITLINHTPYVSRVFPIDVKITPGNKIEIDIPYLSVGYIEVIRFEKFKGKFVLDDPDDARYATYSKLYWTVKGQYYYPCLGSGIYLKLGNVMIGFNKLDVLTKLGFDITDAIYLKTIGKMDMPHLHQITLKDTSPLQTEDELRQYLWETLYTFAEKCSYVKNNVPSMETFNKFFQIRQNIETCEQNVTRTGLKKWDSLYKVEVLNCLKPVINDYIDTFSGQDLVKIYNDPNLTDAEKNLILNKYKDIYDANFNQLVLDATIYRMAKEKGYSQILLTYEPTDKPGIFGFELIDLEDVPILSTAKLSRFGKLERTIQHQLVRNYIDIVRSNIV